MIAASLNLTLIARLCSTGSCTPCMASFEGAVVKAPCKESQGQKSLITWVTSTSAGDYVIQQEVCRVLCLPIRFRHGISKAA